MKLFHQAGNCTDVSDVETEGSGTWQDSHSICTPASSHAEVAPWTWAEVPSSCHHLCGEGVKREEWNVRHLATGTCVSLEPWKAFYWDALEVSVQTGMSVPPLQWVSILLLPSPHSKPLWRRRTRVSADVTRLKSAGRSVNAKDSKSKTVNRVIRKPEVNSWSYDFICRFNTLGALRKITRVLEPRHSTCCIFICHTLHGGGCNYQYFHFCFNFSFVF